jgi:hypothetical protein
LFCNGFPRIDSLLWWLGEAGSHGISRQISRRELPLRQNHTVNAVVSNQEVVFVQHGHRFVVPVRNINEISCGTDVHRRFGAGVHRLVPFVDLDKVEDYYVGVTWTDNTRRTNRTATVDVLFKLNHDEYGDFVAALELLIGKKAVNTSKTPTVVRYDL